MKATEFRIGNTVFYNSENDKNEPVRYYCTINGADLRIMQDDENYLKSHEPIALTPELLEKCGFKKGNICYNNGYSIELLKTDFYLRPSYEGGFYWGFNLSKDKMDCELNDVKSIHYLHQLQNLYFALTGEELEINLEEK